MSHKTSLLIIIFFLIGFLVFFGMVIFPKSYFSQNNLAINNIETKEKLKENKTSSTNDSLPTDSKKQNTQEKNIMVSSPQAGEEISLPLVIKGKARVFENRFSYRLSDSAGNLLAGDNESANSPDMGQYGNFEIAVNYPAPKTNEGVLEVFTNSPKDGAEIDLVSIPIKFQKVETMEIKVFFSVSEEKNNANNCGEVFPVVRRIPKTIAPARAALEELLKGPMTSEILAEPYLDYYTNLNEGVRIQKLEIENGVARVDFSAEFSREMAGSCRVLAARAQIEKTMRQFSTVRSVVITADGKENILEP